MKKVKIAFLILTGILLTLTYSCSVNWTEAIRYGEVTYNESGEATVDIEIQKGLLFVPVSIHGKQYRFLFDSGAPFSISNELQDDYAFKIVSKGNLVDSDHNRTKINWAQVDSINIGGVSFTNHAAFIGDFDANPLLKCLEIDGIIGSNLIKDAYWTIDQEQRTLSLFSTIDKQAFKESVTIPFKTDNQYNIFIDLNVGQATVRNILVDYGSNGSISLNNELFSTLKDKAIIRESFLEKGFKQSGIIGEPVNLSREITFTDSVSVDRIPLEQVMLRTGKTTSVGNDLLSRFCITIDWSEQNLYLTKTGKTSNVNRSPGFKLGYSADKGVYVQSVIEQSNAYEQGVRPNMKVVKIDDLDFENGDNFCHYVEHELKDEIFLQLVDLHGRKQDYHFEKTVYGNN